MRRALEFQPIGLAVLDANDVRHAGLDARGLEDWRLDARAPAAVRDVKDEYVRHAADREVLEDGALDLLLGPAYVH